MHTNTLKAFEQYIAPLLKPGMVCLELSPGRRNPLKRYVRELDYFTASPRHKGSVGMPSDNRIDAPDNRFDAVWSANTLEHVREPWLWIPEQARVTKPGGFVAVIAPVSWREHPQQHEYHDGTFAGLSGERDGWRILPDGIHTLFELSGLTTELAVTVEYGQDTDYERDENRGLPSIDLVAIGRKPA